MRSGKPNRSHDQGQTREARSGLTPERLAQVARDERRDAGAVGAGTRPRSATTWGRDRPAGEPGSTPRLDRRPGIRATPSVMPSTVSVMIGIQPSPRCVRRCMLRGVSVPEKKMGKRSAWTGFGSHQMFSKRTPWAAGGALRPITHRYVKRRSGESVLHADYPLASGNARRMLRWLDENGTEWGDARTRGGMLMGDKSPKSKRRDQKQKRATKVEAVAAAKAKQDGYAKAVVPTAKK